MNVYVCVFTLVHDKHSKSSLLTPVKDEVDSWAKHPSGPERKKEEINWIKDDSPLEKNEYMTDNSDFYDKRLLMLNNLTCWNKDWVMDNFFFPCGIVCD